MPLRAVTSTPTCPGVVPEAVVDGVAEGAEILRVVDLLPKAELQHRAKEY